MLVWVTTGTGKRKAVKVQETKQVAQVLDRAFEMSKRRHHPPRDVGWYAGWLGGAVAPRCPYDEHRAAESWRVGVREGVASRRRYERMKECKGLAFLRGGR